MRGEVLEDEPYADWSQDLRNTYQGRMLGAHLDAADAALAELDFADALAHTEAAATLDRFSERAHRCRCSPSSRSAGKRRARGVPQLPRRLDEELGLAPTPETRALEAAILRQDDVRSLLPRPIAPARRFGAPLRPSARAEGRARDARARGPASALDGPPRCSILEGESGVGKTRLLDELATARRRPCRAVEPLGARATPSLRAARGRAPRRARRRRDRPGPAAGARRVLPELALERASAADEVDALEALVALIREHVPLVLFLDDPQWADPSTIAALSYLQRRCAGLAVAIVAAVRNEQTTPDDPVRHLRPDTLIRLAPLTAADLAPLGIPDLHESTGGNPRLLAEALAGGSELTLTDELAETLLAQCRAEGAWPYRVLLAASLLEPPFDVEPLAALLGIDVTELVEELERLCERRILRVDGPRFRFRYGLVRDVLLRSLSPARTRLLQERLGRLRATGTATRSAA